MPRKKYRTKLLVSVVQPKDAQVLAETLNDITRSLSFAVAAEGTARTNLLDYLGLGSPEKTVVFSLIPEIYEKRMMSAIMSRLKMFMVGRGIAFSVPLSSVSALVADALVKDIQEVRGMNREPGADSKKEKDDRNFELVVACFGENAGEQVIEAARRAGASGGTVIHSRTLESTAVGQVVGVSFQPASQILMILTRKNRRNEIMKAIRDAGGLKTEGTGTVFSVPVTGIIGIGNAPDEFSAGD